MQHRRPIARRRGLTGAISVKHDDGGARTINVHAANLTIEEAESLGALLGVEARAQRAAARRARYAIR